MNLHLPTLDEIWTEYKQLRRLSTTTERNYEQRLQRHLGDFLLLPIDEITPELIKAKYLEIESAAVANHTIRVLNALLYYGAVKYGTDFKKSKRYARVSRNEKRTRAIVMDASMLGQLFQAFWALRDATAKDFLLLLLLTGQRSYDLVALCWDDVDLSAKTIIVRSIRRQGEPHTVPLSDFAFRLLRARKFGAQSTTVFPAKRSAYFPNLAKHYEIVRAKVGIDFMLHDIRISYIALGDALGEPAGAIMQICDVQKDDLTQGFTQRSIDDLRPTVEAISSAILNQVPGAADSVI
jgi:integrase